MKAIIWTKYGPPDGLQLQEIKKTQPKDNEVLVRIHAATVTAGDCEMRSLKLPFWLRLPMRAYVGFDKPTRVTVIGQEMAGEIEAVGKDVRKFKNGDRVFAATGFGKGTYAEYICLPEEPGEMGGVLVLKPENMSYAEAAAVPTGGLEALHFLRKANIQPGQQVLINGAGGSIGTIGVQLAKFYGAEVTAVDSGGKLAMLSALGADHVVDHTRENFTKNGRKYDVIFDVIGKAPFPASLRSLKKTGVYLSANPKLARVLLGKVITIFSAKRVVFETTRQRQEDLLYLKELIKKGKIKTVIDRQFPLAETAEAHHYVESGRKKGNVVINVADAEQGVD